MSSRIKLKKQKDVLFSPEYFRNKIREGVLLLVGAVCLFLLLALFTHSTSDPSWSQIRQTLNQGVINLGGRAGAFLSDLLLSMFGYFAYLLPLLLFYATWIYFHVYREEIGSRLGGNNGGRAEEFMFYFISMRLAGFVLTFLPGCALASLHWILDPPRISGGGLVGQWIAIGGVSVFNVLGANLIFAGLFLTGVTLLTGLSFVKIADYLGECAFSAITSLRNFIFRIDQRIMDPKHHAEMISVGTTNIAPEPEKVDISSCRMESRIKIEPKINLKTLKENPVESDIDEPFISQKPAMVKPADEHFISPKPVMVKPADELFISQQPVVVKPTGESFVSQKPVVVKPYVQFQSHLDETEIDSSLVGTLPPLSLLDMADNSNIQSYSNAELESISLDVETKLQDFGIAVKVVAVHPGPVVTRFELQLAAGTKVSRITTLAKDLARSLSVISVRVVEIIPGKSVIGLELPNRTREVVRLREILSSSAYQEATSPLVLAMGKDIAGTSIVTDLAKMPHLLVAGTTGSGKSVGLNAMLLSLLYKATPDQLRLILIDPKMLELSIYDGIPHLLTPVVTDMKDAANALRWCVVEMDRRYKLMAALGVRNLLGYNTKVEEAAKSEQPILDPFWNPEVEEIQRALEPLPYVVVLVDEFADMMMVVGKKVEELIARIAQKARAAGIHLILATQRPSVDVITGLIKANVPTRVAFQVSSRIDSRTILDQQGAEQLLGHGDMLYLPPGSGVPIRIHGAFVADEEVHRVVRDIKRRGQPQYLNILEGEDKEGGDGVYTTTGDQSGEQDPLYDQAVQIVIETRRASISNIQRRLKIGYNRAANIVEAMEAAGVVSSMDNTGAREVLVANNNA